MSKQAEADLILKLYDLRREAVMRQARAWCFREFHPESMTDFNSAMFGEHGAYIRMVFSYWDMAAALVNHGAISLDLFEDANGGEHFAMFSKVETLLEEIRAAHGPQFLRNLEKLIDAIPEGRKRVAAMRERMKQVRAQFAAKDSNVRGNGRTDIQAAAERTAAS